MDLFGDLPEPTCKETKESKNSTSTYICPDNSCGQKRSLDDNEKSVGGPSKRRATGRLNDNYHQLKCFVADRKGEREEMQDAHTFIDDFVSEVESLPSNVYDEMMRIISVPKIIDRLAYYAVFDGHGGTKASKYAAQHLHKIIAQKFPKGEENLEKDLRKCFVESFKKLDEDFLNEARRNKPSWKDGSTAVAVLAVNNMLYIGNLGDSKAVICRFNEASKKFTAIPLTVDHNPTLYEERMRIQKAGGYVREGRVMGILEVSRSIGDGSFKQHGVCCVPDVKRCQITDNDRFVLIACDGLWKRFEDYSAIEFINSVLEDDKIVPADTKDADDVRMDLACQKLANEAVRRLSADNVTVMLVGIRNKKASELKD